MFGMEYIEPELRENTGEIELARKHALRERLVGYDNLCGDLQVRTDWTNGTNFIDSMAKAAMMLGLKYIAITDHTKRLGHDARLGRETYYGQGPRSTGLNRKFSRKESRSYAGSECDILKDGSLDLPDKILAKLDVVGASVHSHINLPRGEQTARIKRAMANPNVDILSTDGAHHKSPSGIRRGHGGASCQRAKLQGYDHGNRRFP